MFLSAECNGWEIFATAKEFKGEFAKGFVSIGSAISLDGDPVPRNFDDIGDLYDTEREAVENYLHWMRAWAELYPAAVDKRLGLETEPDMANK